MRVRVLWLSLVFLIGCMGVAEDPAGSIDAPTNRPAPLAVANARGPAATGALIPQLVNASEFVSQNVPTSVTAGQAFTVSVTMKNTGSTVWELGPTGHFLGAEGPRDNSLWGTNRVYMKAGEKVLPGESYSFSGPVTAPLTPGNHPMQWQLLQNDVEWFGAKSPSVTVKVLNPGAPPGSTPAQIVAFHRAKYGTPMARPDVLACLRAIAKDLNAKAIPDGPYGILVKTAGNNCEGYSCDIICTGQGGAQRQWDVLSDSPDTAGPMWHEVAPPVAQRPCEIQ